MNALEVNKVEHSSTLQNLVFNQRCLESCILQLQLQQSESNKVRISGFEILWKISERLKVKDSLTLKDEFRDDKYLIGVVFGKEMEPPMA